MVNASDRVEPLLLLSSGLAAQYKPVVAELCQLAARPLLAQLLKR